MLNRDTLNTLFSLLAVVISAAALIISYSDYSAKKESLRIVATPIKRGYDLRYDDFHCPEICGVARTQWDLVIYNTSDRTMTVDEPTIKWLGTEVTEYTYLKGQTFIEGKVAGFPISIDPGKHVKLVQEIGVPVPENALRLLKRDYPKEKVHPIQEIQKGLALEKTDLFGNRVQYMEFVDGGSLVEVNQVDFNPTFAIGFETSRNSKFEGVGKWY